MRYTIIRTDKLDDQMAELLHYIAINAGSVDVARRYLEKLEHAISLLRETPHMGSIPRYTILKRKGYRVLIVERHLIFYMVNDETQVVTVHAVVDGRRDYLHLI